MIFAQRIDIGVDVVVIKSLNLNQSMNHCKTQLVFGFSFVGYFIVQLFPVDLCTIKKHFHQCNPLIVLYLMK